MQNNDNTAGFGLYIHWPFCRSKCPYCDFNSHVEGMVDHERWRTALLRELDHVADSVGRRALTSIFFGGGTPSLMDPRTTEALITRAIERFGAEPGIEITLEANPTSAERQRLADFKSAGVNRLSLGVQALDVQTLRFLGREHGVDEALAAVDHAAGLFRRFSFDLIYARPDQTPDAWAAELDRALDHAGGHLSVYQLTIEPGTRFFNLHQRGQLVLPEDDLQADLFELTREKLAAASLPAYEISNHAAEGEACRHNLVYWRAGDYAGIGPGAHGRLTIGDRRFATSTERMPRAWLERVETTGHAEQPREPIARDEQVVEMLLMGLRLEDGIDIRRLQHLSGRPLRETLNAEAIAAFEAEGWLHVDDRRLAATAAGLARLNAILTALLDRPASELPIEADTSLDERLIHRSMED
ncbi:MAG: radical SAM family heme chaperone HemW [Geminicoccaceae bacterium]